MSLIPWKPFFEPLEDLEKYFKEDFPFLSSGKVKGFIPTIDVYENKGNVVVEVPLAGVDPKDVEVAIENDVLSIKGKSEHKTEVDEKDYYRREVRYGSFYRSVALPAHVDGDKTKAEFEDGLLKVVAPKIEVAKTKTVLIKKTAAKKKTATKSKKKK